MPPSFEPQDAVPAPGTAHALTGMGGSGWRIALGLRVRSARSQALVAADPAVRENVSAWIPPSSRSRSASAAEPRGSLCPSGTRCCGSTPRAATTTEIEVGNVPRDPAFGFGSVWVAMGKDGTVWRIDPRTERARAIVKTGKGPWGIAVGGGSVWVTNHCVGTVSRIDPETDEVVATIELGLFPQWLAVGRRACLGRCRGHAGRPGRVLRRVPLDSPP